MAECLILSGGGAPDIDELTTSPNEVLSGEKFYGTGSDEIQVGTMPNKGSDNYNANRCAMNGTNVMSVINDSGYYEGGSNGSGILVPQTTVASVGGLTSGKLAIGQSALGIAGTYKGLGNANTNQVLKGSTFSTATLSNATGTIPSRGAATIVPSTVTQTAISGGYYANDNVLVMGDSNLKPENIVKGVTIFNKTGTADTLPTGDIYDLYNRGVTSPLVGGWNFYYYTTYNSEQLIKFYPNYIDMWVRNGTGGGGSILLSSLNEININTIDKFKFTNLEFTITEATGSIVSQDFPNNSQVILAYGIGSSSHYEDIESRINVNKNYLNYTLIVKHKNDRMQDILSEGYLKIKNECYVKKPWVMRIAVKRIWLSQV